MNQLGDITKLSGFDVPPVDCVIGGSPCQDLSIAGKRAGLQGTRSGLFMEQIRLIKEMRDADIQRGRTGMFVRPRYMVWENVPGAFNSNKGGDFKSVLEETIRIAEPEAPDIPLPEKGRWPLADAYYGDGWSIAYRVFDAQFWGVPQRRRRIALVADFGGKSAPEILFIRQSLQGNFEQSKATGWEEDTDGTGGGAYPAIARTLTARNDGSPCYDRGPNVIFQAIHQNQNGELREGTSVYTLSTNGNASGRNAPLIFCIQGNVIDRDAKMNGIGIALEPMFTLNTIDRHAVFDARGNGDGRTVCTITGDHQSRVTDYTVQVMSGQANAEICENLVPTLNCNHEQPIVYAKQYQVRKLTPIECERLQGFPDRWTDIGEWIDSKGKRRQSTDSARYRALGNSIALPNWTWVLKRIAAQYERSATLASLFDGIGGFPLIWERLNGQGTAIWASEVDEFAIAVTRYHFGWKGGNDNVT